MVFISSLWAHSQTLEFNAGLNAGISATQIHGDGYGGYNKAGLKIGGISSLKLSEKFGAQFEINFIQKGSVSPNKPDKGQIYRRIDLNYIEIPFLIRYPYKKLVFEGGLSYAQLLNSYQQDIFGEMQLIGPFHKYEVAFNIGVNYKIFKRFYMNWRYSQSITPITDSVVFDTDFMGIFGGSFNLVMAFSVNYYFFDAQE